MRRLLRPASGILLTLLIVTLVWETARFLLGPPEELFPPLKEVFAQLMADLRGGNLLPQILFSMGMIAAGLSAGVGASVLLVFLAELHPLFGRLIDGAAAVFHPLPGIALLPVVILWFGTGIPAVLVIIIHSVLWPLTTALKSGYESIPRTYLLVADNYGFGSGERFVKVTLPASFPYLLAGLKISWARAWRALISAEMVFGAVAYAGGLGWYIFSKRVFMDTAGIFSGLTAVVLIGVIVEQGLLRPLERVTIERWGMHR